MKTLITAAILLTASPAIAAPVTATPAQWETMRAMVGAMMDCDPDAKEQAACKRWRALEAALAKQGIMHYKRGGVCKLAYDGPKADRVTDEPWKDGKFCYDLRDPAHR
jgi:hypothetical protein